MSLIDKNKDKVDEKFLGYLYYFEKEDIYCQEEEVEDLDLEMMKCKKIEKDFVVLDVLGVELDDEQERIGNEDEENNYYSFGGDDYENFEENNDEFDFEKE